MFASFVKRVQNEYELNVICIRSDHGGEFESHAFDKLCEEPGIKHEYSSPRTPQQNGVVERKNRTLQDIGRTILNEHCLPKFLWREAINCACYVINRLTIRNKLNKISYELLNGKSLRVDYFRVFGCKCFILNTKDNLPLFERR